MIVTPMFRACHYSMNFIPCVLSSLQNGSRFSLNTDRSERLIHWYCKLSHARGRGFAPMSVPHVHHNKRSLVLSPVRH